MGFEPTSLGFVVLRAVIAPRNQKKKFEGLSGESNPGPCAPKAQIIPLDH